MCASPAITSSSSSIPSSKTGVGATVAVRGYTFGARAYGRPLNRPTWSESVGVPNLTGRLRSPPPTPPPQVGNQSAGYELLQRVAERVTDEIRRCPIESQAIVTSFYPVAIEIIHRVAPGWAFTLNGNSSLRTFCLPHFDTGVRRKTRTTIAQRWLSSLVRCSIPVFQLAEDLTIPSLTSIARSTGA